MYEPLIAETWLVQKLNANSTLRGLVNSQFYGYVAPANATYPFIVFRFMPGSDSNDVIGLGGRRIMTHLIYSVEAVDDQNTFNRIGQMAELIDQILHQASGSVTGGTVISSIRTAPLAGFQIDEASGAIFRTLGGIFDIQVQKA